VDRVYFEEILREMRAMRPTRRPPEALRQIRETVQSSREILDLQDGWDGNGATRIYKTNLDTSHRIPFTERAGFMAQARSSDGQAASRSRPRWLD